MVIEWSIENFRSFLEKQEISCEATTDSSLRDLNVFEVQDKGVNGVLKIAAIFGANSSGKSNCINALSHLQHIAIKGIRDGGTEDYNAGSLSHTKNIEKHLSSNIELVVLVDEIKYHYGVSISYWGTIEKEFLNVYLTTKPQKWFSRNVVHKSGYEYEVCVKLKGDKNIWEKATDFTDLFLAKASKLGSKQLLPFYEWLCNELVFLDAHNLSPIAEKLRKSGSYKGINELCRFLDLPYGHSDEDLINFVANFTSIRHGRAIPMYYDKESDASLELWDFAFVLLDVFRHGRTLVVDSFLDKLDLITIRKVLELFHNSAINPKKSQLFFTTHIVSLLDQKLFRRDQIWFVEKKYELTPYMHEGCSELHRLTEFSPRKSDNIERNYLVGEYIALPKPGDISALINAIGTI